MFDSRKLLNRFQECQWTKIVSSIGPRKVSKLMCAKSSDPQCPFLIYVGTSGTDRYMSSLYVLDPSRTATEPWSELPLAGQSLRVVDLLPYHVSGLDGQSMVRSGVVVLHEPASGTSPPSLACNILALDSTQRQFHHNHKLETGGLGNISAIGINLDSWGLVILILSSTCTAA